MIVNGNINFNNNRSATTGNSARDILITGTGTDGTAAPNTGYLDLGGGVRTITVATTSTGSNAVDTDATIETIIENGGIVKEGARMLILSGDNTYTGGTTINAGAIRVGSGGTTGSLLGNILNNAALEFNRSNLSTFAGDISGTGTLTKLGAGILVLSGTNTYGGLTTISAGAIRGNVGTGNLILNGGVYERSGALNVDIGSGNGQVRWGVGTHGGFSANGGQLTVTLSSGLQLVWDANTEFVNGTGQLLFGSTGSDNVVELVNSIDLNGAVRTVQVLDNTSSTADKAVLSGVLSGTGASALTKTGAGTLELRGVNTFEGALTVSAGILQFSQNENLGGTGGNAVTLGGGSLQYIGTTASAYSGTITLSASSTISNVGGGILPSAVSPRSRRI
ncbi:autotransporter-associated beta strand repeat-containing protein [Verrucomicrobium spinosum]|uniref:autotransporter-associated beta strand repeat-containing protein n=1 Tax=Verrucomicrobium spinosum TaxID=2736 RepID=UPI00094684F6|nr:autotransporter-associated beta strand repeat-containing protein [Verrucomicrobium spinosum]